MSTFESINVTNGQQADAAAAANGPVRVGGTYLASAPTLTTGQANSLQLDANANLKTVVENGVSSGTAGSPSSNVLTTQPIAGTSYSNTIITSATPAVVTVKGSAGSMIDLIALNFTNGPVFLHFFDATSVTLGTTSASFTLGIPGNTSGAGIAPPLKIPRKFVNAINYAVTGNIAANDNTNIATTGVIVDITYI